MDLGEFEQAEQLFARWPGERSGYEYWKWEGIICDEVRHDDDGHERQADHDGDGDQHFLNHRAHSQGHPAGWDGRRRLNRRPIGLS